MAAISVFSPSIDEKRWVSHSSRAIDSELKIEIDSIPTIFEIPKPTNETKPEAYTPQIVGLGPYHHLRPELYNAHRQKLAGVKNFLKSRKFSDRIKDLEPVVRANYDNYLDLEGTTLESIVAIDTFYLLDFLGSYDDKTEAENLEPGHLELAKDVIMLENQIPAFALAEMGKELDFFSPTKGTEETMLYSQLFYYFCKAQSPLELAELSEIRSSKSKHLLAHLYHLIVNPGPGIATVSYCGFPSEISESIEKGIECFKNFKRSRTWRSHDKSTSICFRVPTSFGEEQVS